MRRYMWVTAGGAFLLCLFALFYVFDGRAKAESDYMAQPLRAQVEELKKNVRAHPTTGANFNERLSVFWDWVNAYSMTGHAADPYWPGFVGSTRESLALKIAPGEIDYQGVPATRVLDNFVYALSLLDDDPQALGNIVIDNRGPFVAGSFQTVRITYTIGNAGMQSGGGVLIGQHLMPDNMYFQTKDAKADNYVSITSSRQGASFEREDINFRGFLGRSSYLGMPTIFRLRTGELVKGDTITITYGDISAGSKGLHMPSYASDRVPFQLYLALDKSDRLIALPLMSVETIGMATEGVHGFAPSIVEPGEPFILSVRSQDHFYNRASGAIPAYDVFLNGKKFREIAAGRNAITLIRNIKLAEEGVYRFTIRSRDGKIEGAANPILVQKNPPLRIYWGETHAHSGMAEGIGSTESFWTYGREDARLDFLAHTDHDAQMDDNEWAIVRQNAIDMYKPGEFIPFLAYEFSSDWELGGHHNVLFRTPENRQRVPNQTHTLLADLHKGLQAQNDPRDVLVIPHAHNPGDWKISAPKLESLVEIMSGHGTFEWFGQKYLENGWEVGFVGGSDDHISHPGYSSPWHRAAGMFQVGGLAAVFAPEKSRNAIFDSLKAKHNYATTGERMLLFVKLNGKEVGQRIAFSPDRKIEGRVIGTGPLESVSIIKNGKTVFSEDWMTDTQSSLGSDVRVQIAFNSASSPRGDMRETPRGPRPWRGTLDIAGAELVKATAVDFDNPRLQQITRVGDTQVEFDTLTRGSRSSIVLDLKNATPESIVTLNLEGATVRKATGPGALNVEGDKVPAQTITIKLKDILGGAVSTNIPAGAFVDVVSVRRIRAKQDLERVFSFTDTDAFGQGDYYYVRVNQLDGAIAWSSPIWVGGNSPH